MLLTPRSPAVGLAAATAAGRTCKEGAVPGSQKVQLRGSLRVHRRQAHIEGQRRQVLLAARLGSRAARGIPVAVRAAQWLLR
jgi:hypothetical protein